ncbi:unnamed protein product [marine sediment metagenome]|uniref:HEPN domain-containing protein n=1 Tax=marine sediment metagenome TaxID=412755 RepID=X1RNW3_9ZZZZ
MKDSVREMIKSQIEKSTEKLDAARMLCREGFIDDAISRAYYSMFHSTSAVLLSEEITVFEEDDAKEAIKNALKFLNEMKRFLSKNYNIS